MYASDRVLPANFSTPRNQNATETFLKYRGVENQVDPTRAVSVRCVSRIAYFRRGLYQPRLQTDALETNRQDGNCGASNLANERMTGEIVACQSICKTGGKDLARRSASTRSFQSRIGISEDLAAFWRFCANLTIG